ncbi:SDR family oxidoreductase [Oricola nitratireducens]|uniref:SDR family oxidoreductase n=1 Tax=Oricola nitratireducens TaxID=2775868 RepID=UPI001867BBF0|nr:SDR family oxidoreductase [Oricola nitratireducens]
MAPRGNTGPGDELFTLSDRIAIVTGGMGQLGLEYTRALVARGARVAVFDIAETPGQPNPDIDDAIARERILPLRVDITDSRSISGALEQVVRSFGVPHILVNNAGLDSPPDAPPEENGPFESFPEASFDRVMDVNVKGTMLCCQAVGGRMAAAGRGSIINISSIYGILSPVQDIYEYRRQQGETFYKPVAYSASKSAVINLTRYLATYWAKKGVRVNTLTLAGILNDQPAEFLEAYLSRMPIGRMMNAEEVIGPMVFLASDASSYMTGSNVIVDGGWSSW